MKDCAGDGAGTGGRFDCAGELDNEDIDEDVALNNVLLLVLLFYGASLMIRQSKSRQ